MLAEKLAQAGLVSAKAAQAAEAEISRKNDLKQLCDRVQRALERKDFVTYMKLRARLPRRIRANF